MPGQDVFRPLSEANFADARGRKPLKLWAPEWIETSALPVRVRRGRGATVNRCTGRAGTGFFRRRIFRADFESMEGAACALIGAELGIPVMEVRAISNIAGDRDMRPENVVRALQSLRLFWRECRPFLA
jgi:futalosine hydrolase